IHLPRPFIIIATQNPIEQEGTFALPEAQLDRFLLRLELGLPSKDEEEEIILRYQTENPLDGLNSVADAEELLSIGKICGNIYCDSSVRDYIIALCRKTREHEDVKLGASPRATLGLHIASQAMAAVHGRNYIIPDDVKALVVPVLAHRLMIETDARLRGRGAKDILKDVISQVPVPVE
ncbi:MAG: MoxR family ATPase, partial [Desulfobacterales bacterium]|nr:MoxR family ATPase [Desulfobacterales bacterium]